MNHFKHFLATGLLLAGLATLPLPAPASAEKLDAPEIVKRSQAAFYYPGADMKATVVMELINNQGQKRLRELTMLRKNLPGENQKYFMYFHQPGDVRRMTFMVWKYPNRDDDRWIFIPAVNMTRRIAASDKRSSFVGSDFTYEDVSGRDLAADNHTLLRTEPYNGKSCYVVQSLPREETGYSKKLSWIDQATFLPLKEEYYDARGELFRVFTADELKPVRAGNSEFPSVIRRTMKDVKSGHHTEVTFRAIAYNVGLPDDLFTERSLRKPPARWTGGE